MVSNKYLANILQHSSPNNCLHEDSETKQQMYFHCSLPVFNVVMVISVWKPYNYDNYKTKNVHY